MFDARKYKVMTDKDMLISTLEYAGKQLDSAQQIITAQTYAIIAISILLLISLRIIYLDNIKHIKYETKNFMHLVKYISYFLLPILILGIIFSEKSLEFSLKIVIYGIFAVYSSAAISFVVYILINKLFEGKAFGFLIGVILFNALTFCFVYMQIG